MGHECLAAPERPEHDERSGRLRATARVRAIRGRHLLPNRGPVAQTGLTTDEESRMLSRRLAILMGVVVVAIASATPVAAAAPRQFSTHRAATGTRLRPDRRAGAGRAPPSHRPARPVALGDRQRSPQGSRAAILAAGGRSGQGCRTCRRAESRSRAGAHQSPPRQPYPSHPNRATRSAPPKRWRRQGRGRALAWGETRVRDCRSAGQTLCQ